MNTAWRSLSQFLPNHALAKSRVSPATYRSPGTAITSKTCTESPSLDTSTLAAHDFDVDVRSGFMPPEPPVQRLPSAWQEWEEALDDAIDAKLRVGDSINITPDEAERSQLWRKRVEKASSSPVALPRSRLMPCYSDVYHRSGHAQNFRETSSSSPFGPCLDTSLLCAYPIAES